MIKKIIIRSNVMKNQPDALHSIQTQTYIKASCLLFVMQIPGRLSRIYPQVFKPWVYCKDDARHIDCFRCAVGYFNSKENAGARLRQDRMMFQRF